MTTAITDTYRRVEISDVREVVVTDIITADGMNSRSIRILGDMGGDQPTEVMEIVIRSATKADLEMKAPEQRF